jgi:hypothetical protein
MVVSKRNVCLLRLSPVDISSHWTQHYPFLLFTPTSFLFFIFFDVDSVLRFLHLVDVGDDVDVSEVHAGSKMYLRNECNDALVHTMQQPKIRININN